MKQKLSHSPARPARRRGSVYIAILGAGLVVATLAAGGILATRVQARANEANNDASDAKSYAQSGLELARLWMKQDSAWRTNRTSGVWSSGLSVGSGSVAISVVDSLDNNLANRPYDSVTVTATGRKGLATQILQQTLVATPTPLPALRYALHTAGQLHIKASANVIIGSNTISTNGSFRNENTLEGNADIGTLTTAGTCFGTITSGVATRAMPDSTVPESYASLGTLISLGSNTMDKQVLGPGQNPYGTANADGVYVIRSTSDLTIRNSRIYGTLVVICPGKKVTLDQSVLFQPARTDYPCLIVNGDAVFQFDSTGSLSEATQAVNFNPTGVPYLGATDADKTDNYPCELDGLIHVTGALQINKPCVIRGAVICESSASSDAVNINTSTLQINYDSSLYTNPPQFYTTSVQMQSLAGSYKRVTN